MIFFDFDSLKINFLGVYGYKYGYDLFQAINNIEFLEMFNNFADRKSDHI